MSSSSKNNNNQEEIEVGDLQFDLINDIESNNQNYNDNINNNINNLNENINLRSIDTNFSQNINEIYIRNKKINCQKIETTVFMHYIIKIELLFQTLQGHLYWTSLVEFFVFFILFCLFWASPKEMAKIWWFIFHILRGVFGVLIIINLPKTFEVIDSLKVIPEELKSLKKSLIEIFLDLLQQKQKKLKLFLMIYFSCTVLCTIIDIMMFCVVTPDCGLKGEEKSFLFLMISSLILTYCDIIYYNFFSSFKFYFNKEQQNIIQRATVIGFFDQLKIGMAKKIVYITKKVQTGIHKNNSGGGVASSKDEMKKDTNGEEEVENNANIQREVQIDNNL